MTWQPIETAPRGGFPPGSRSVYVTDPDWVEPQTILLSLNDGTVCSAHWDWYYAEGGNGYDGRASAWVLSPSGERVADYGEPTHWMPLPALPAVPR